MKQAGGVLHPERLKPMLGGVYNLGAGDGMLSLVYRTLSKFINYRYFIDESALPARLPLVGALWGTNMKYGLTLSLLILAVPKALACDYPPPTIIPPTTPYGEFQYIYPETGLNYKDIANDKNLAVVKILEVSGDQANPDVVIVQLLHGWGYQSGRYMKFVNPGLSCVSNKVAKIGWYAALIDRDDIALLVPYKKVEKYLRERGKPEYVYSAIGLRFREAYPAN
ncbi:hypothetical protein ACG1BZ_11480 [Microbulbifer sp. CNSA002]|uniref:hypothetical protein n=1 Tax=Microbulbifer sp. CNSA002 TaxID=3373604 RepID=UPI0039B6268B